MNITVTIKLNQEEKQLFEEYSKVYKGGLYSMTKELSMEKLKTNTTLSPSPNFKMVLKMVQ